jgi:hypothetical protein
MEGNAFKINRIYNMVFFPGKRCLENAYAAGIANVKEIITVESARIRLLVNHNKAGWSNRTALKLLKVSCFGRKEKSVLIRLFCALNETDNAYKIGIMLIKHTRIKTILMMDNFILSFLLGLILPLIPFW